MRYIHENAFRVRLQSALKAADLSYVGAVTGPGRSGAIAAAYASQILGIPFLSFGARAPAERRVLIVDIARESGRQVRNALRMYKHNDPVAVIAFDESGKTTLWYEATPVGEHAAA